MSSQNSSEIKRLIKYGAECFGVSISETQLQKLYLLIEELKIWNRRFKFTSLRSEKDIVEKHIIDSLTLLPHLGEGEKLLDVGSGAGFPSLPLKIARPIISVTSVDSNRRRINFQRQMVRLLKLNSFRPIRATIKPLERTKGIGLDYDWTVSRAMCSWQNSIKLMFPYISKYGEMILMLGPDPPDQEEILKQVAEFNLYVKKMIKFSLPFSSAGRSLVFLSRLKN
jgi:16S rRNA (guanine527-N7)-methyltransferase